MKKDLKLQILTRARLARGLTNVLKDNVECINIDADYFDIFNLEESVIDARDTVCKFSENLREIEAILSSIKEPRK